MQAVHLSFADNLLLFSRRDLSYVRLIYGLFKEFLVAFGLEANVDKSAIYFGGVTTKVQ